MSKFHLIYIPPHNFYRLGWMVNNHEGLYLGSEGYLIALTPTINWYTRDL